MGSPAEKVNDGYRVYFYAVSLNELGEAKTYQYGLRTALLISKRTPVKLLKAFLFLDDWV
jgi:hypothetical protein